MFSFSVSHPVAAALQEQPSQGSEHGPNLCPLVGLRCLRHSGQHLEEKGGDWDGLISGVS